MSNRSKRRRATAVVIHNNKVLSVRDRGKRSYPLPGGGINRDEPSVSGAAREVYEETRLSVREVERLFDYEEGTQAHQVCLVTLGDCAGISPPIRRKPTYGANRLGAAAASGERAAGGSMGSAQGGHHPQANRTGGR